MYENMSQRGGVGNKERKLFKIYTPKNEGIFFALSVLLLSGGIPNFANFRVVNSYH